LLHPPKKGKNQFATKTKGASAMLKLISSLLCIIEFQAELIRYLIVCFAAKPAKCKEDDPINKPYRKLAVDEMPIFEKVLKGDYNHIIQDHLSKTGVLITPVKHRKDSKVPKDLICPYCGAPCEYLYDNNGGRGQYLCKVCTATFHKTDRPLRDVVLKCPHCRSVLQKVKTRKDFDLFKCTNDNCKFYTKNLSNMSRKQKEDFIVNPYKYKVRYIYRKFNIDFTPLSKSSPVVTRVSLPKIQCSQYVLGLILTYAVNYGLPARKVAALMFDVHKVKLSHQTILNHLHSVAPIVKPFVDGFPYDLSDQLCGDETYIKVNGKWHYIFFFLDAVKKIILSYRVSSKRDTFTAIKAVDDVLAKLKEIPKGLKLITDGNPIYVLAQHFFREHKIFFDVVQVIGLTNDDEVSAEYRPLKQIIERLNRTFKGNYKATCGFGSEIGSVYYVDLFAAYFNFLRPHSALEKKVPAVIPELQVLEDMPAKWIRLIAMSEEYIQKAA
jgi:transposase-like protein/DNA-directed RNA polymerase subunit RPC12/RpoP